MKYEKKPIKTTEQINRFRERSLLISDEEKAKEYLHNISYYGLRAYTYPIQENREGEDHIFLRDDITFEDVIDLYCFNRRLRSLLFNAIEKIEVALRTRIALTYFGCLHFSDSVLTPNHKSR
jgi:abortive infection bacteriophage resistance protein